jgi:drug/metabolite transporter (DMT)-like permease
MLAAALPVLAGVLLEGLPSPAVLLGIGLAIVAVPLVSRVSAGEGSSREGLGLALTAGAALGTFNITIAHVTVGLVFGPLAIVRFVEALCVIAMVAATRTPWRLSERILSLALIVGVLDMSGNAFFILARQAGQLATAAALSSLYPVTTVILAAAFLRERITVIHALGIVAAAAAIVLITTGSPI